MLASFFKAEKSLTIDAIKLISGASYHGVEAHVSFDRVSAISAARIGDITFAANNKQREHVLALNGAALFCTAELAAIGPASCYVFVHANPALAFYRVARDLYSAALKLPTFEGCLVQPNGSYVHPSALIEADVVLSPGSLVGAHAEIGAGSFIGSRSSIAAYSTIGRGSQIGANATVHCSHIGDNVMIGPGCCIGHDGFGFVAGPEGLEKVPQLGRVIIQNRVEIGANSCVDRGSLSDTVIGEGTKIDNLVQVAHNVRIGRNCAIAAQVGLAGSVTIGDNAMLGGACSISEHMIINDGAMIAAMSGVMSEVPAGARYGGIPAMPLKQFFREVVTLRTLAARQTKS